MVRKRIVSTVMQEIQGSSTLKKSPKNIKSI